MSKIVSPLRYPGGKSKLVKKLDAFLPAGKFEEYREPFVGGASMFFHAWEQRKAETYTLSDAFTPLVAFWQTVADNAGHREWLCKELRDLINTQDGEVIHDAFATARAALNSGKYSHRRLLAYYFFVVNRCSFSGSTCSGGYSPRAAVERFTLSSVDRIEKAATAFSDPAVLTTLHHFKYPINRAGRDVFMYCDPPYLRARGLYGVNGDLHRSFDHEELFRELARSPHRWLLSYDDAPEIRHLYKDFHIHEIAHTNSMDNVAGNTPKRVTELAITNYEVK